jgi:pimeloyl-ACP methyl ester carboxylesterase
MNIIHKRLAIAGIVAVGLVALGVMAFGMLWLWPQKDSRLQQAQPKTYIYSQAIQLIQKQQTEEQTPQSGCHSLLKTHDQPAKKAVLLLHGYTMCPSQFEAMAQYFYNQGYNVYAPLAPNHASSLDLVQFADESLNVTAALGQDVGVVGMSSGGVLATWLAEYRSDVVQHMLVISPLYEPSAEQVPKWQTKAFLAAYGNKLVPDVTSGNWSYYDLAQYMRIVPNLRDQPDSSMLKTVGSVVAPTDKAIDQALAFSIPNKIAGANHLTLSFFQPPAASSQYGGNLYARYFTMYETDRL